MSQQVSPPNALIVTVDAGDQGERLDAFLAKKIDGWSRSRLRRLIEDGDVLVNEKEARPSYKLREGDEIDIDLTEEPAARFEPENIPLDIVYEDEYLAVINKPAGMVMHRCRNLERHPGKRSRVPLLVRTPCVSGAKEPNTDLALAVSPQAARSRTRF
jgi:23S rRNA-/tRNA-specific pseudouridylate synthase